MKALMTGRKDVQKKERKEGISTNRKRKGKEPISNQGKDKKE